MACVPFSEAHTGEHIHERLVMEIVDWDIIEKVGPCLRDNAANVVAAFSVNIQISWLGQNFNDSDQVMMTRIIVITWLGPAHMAGPSQRL